MWSVTSVARVDFAVIGLLFRLADVMDPGSSPANVFLSGIHRHDTEHPQRYRTVDCALFDSPEPASRVTCCILQ